MQSLSNFFEDTRVLEKDRAVLEAHDVDPHRFQEIVPRDLYGWGWKVRGPVRLDHEGRRVTIEVRVEGTYRMLSAELRTVEPPIPEKAPQVTLGRCGGAPEGTRTLRSRREKEV